MASLVVAESSKYTNWGCCSSWDGAEWSGSRHLRWAVITVWQAELRVSLTVILCRPQARSKTNLHYLVFHLTLADSIVSYVVLPLETLWRLTIEWHAGNLACKILMMFRTGGFILSSFILVVICIDRLESIDVDVKMIFRMDTLLFLHTNQWYKHH